MPHIIVTSLQLAGDLASSSSSVASFSTSGNSNSSQDAQRNILSVVGSTMRSDRSARLFKIDVPQLDCFFSGTGDMFAALTVARLREAVFYDTSTTPPLRETESWISPDNVTATQLPLAKATEKVLSSMQSILEKTMIARNEELAKYDAEEDADLASLPDSERKSALEKRAHLRQTKAAEVRLVRNVDLLKHPVIKINAEEWTL